MAAYVMNAFKSLHNNSVFDHRQEKRLTETCTLLITRCIALMADVICTLFSISTMWLSIKIARLWHLSIWLLIAYYFAWAVHIHKIWSISWVQCYCYVWRWYNHPFVSCDLVPDTLRPGDKNDIASYTFTVVWHFHEMWTSCCLHCCVMIHMLSAHMSHVDRRICCPCDLGLWPFTLKLVYRSHLTWETFT